MGFLSDGSGQFDLMEKIGLDQVNLHVVFFSVGLDRVRSGSNQLDFFKNQIGSDSNPNGSDGFLESNRIVSPLTTGYSSLVFYH
jgi:hypothetical protein